MSAPGVRERKLRLVIQGMQCPCCADEVLAAVRAVPGVEQAELDYQAGALTVDGSFHAKAVANANELPAGEAASRATELQQR